MDDEDVDDYTKDYSCHFCNAQLSGRHSNGGARRRNSCFCFSPASGSWGIGWVGRHTYMCGAGGRSGAGSVDSAIGFNYNHLPNTPGGTGTHPLILNVLFSLASWLTTFFSLCSSWRRRLVCRCAFRTQIWFWHTTHKYTSTRRRERQWGRRERERRHWRCCERGEWPWMIQQKQRRLGEKLVAPHSSSLLLYRFLFSSLTTQGNWILNKLNLPYLKAVELETVRGRREESCWNVCECAQHCIFLFSKSICRCVVAVVLKQF